MLDWEEGKRAIVFPVHRHLYYRVQPYNRYVRSIMGVADLAKIEKHEWCARQFYSILSRIWEEMKVL